MSKIAVYCLDRRFNRYKAKIRVMAQRCLKAMGKKPMVLDIYLANDKTMRGLNKRFRGRDKATDVLSFNESKGFPHPELKGRYLGEIYISPSYAQTLRHSITQLLIHGMLHLLGYNHQKKNDRIKMEKLEKFLISKI